MACRGACLLCLQATIAAMETVENSAQSERVEWEREMLSLRATMREDSRQAEEARRRVAGLEAQLTL